MSRFTKVHGLAFIVCLIFYTGTQAANRVFFKPEAPDEYLIERSRNESMKMQTYQFMKRKVKEEDQSKSFLNYELPTAPREIMQPQFEK